MKDGLIRLDTGSFDNLISKKQDLLKKYEDIFTEYERITTVLLENWKGSGAYSFKKDSDKVRANIVGINDILKTMCDTLEDCRDIFNQVDKKIGDYNANPETE